jgi:hypothetical protein
MLGENETIKIINAPQQVVAAASGDYLPKEGDESKPEFHAGWRFWEPKSVPDLAEQLKDTKAKVVKMIEGLGTTIYQGMELDEISVGLSVSIEGSIGIASAGAESSIELKFKIIHASTAATG